MLNEAILLRGHAASAALCLGLANLPAIRISQDRRFFVTEDGQPFFYLADTAWTMVSHLNAGEIDLYLADRKAKGFTVIQLVLVPWDARSKGTVAGERPFIANDIGQPNPRYFDFVEEVLEKIEAQKLYPAVVPFWLAGAPELKPGDLQKYQAYASYLGKRFGHRQMFWILGADRSADGFQDLIRSFAAKLESSAARRNLLITHHPQGGQSSSRWFHAEGWLDFNMLQSGHNLDINHYRLIEEDFARKPTKPVLDGEPAYERLVSALEQYHPGARLVTDYDIRRQAYQSVFAGAAGHAYGACEVYEFFRKGDGKARWTVGMPWQEALQLPGSRQVGFVANLICSRTPLTRMPDNSLIVSENPGDPSRHLAAMRCRAGRYAFVYSPQGEPFRVRTSLLSGKKLRAWWYNPRDGKAGEPETLTPTNSVQFAPPTRGPDQDWVLVIDDAAANFAPPALLIHN